MTPSKKQGGDIVTLYGVDEILASRGERPASRKRAKRPIADLPEAFVTAYVDLSDGEYVRVGLIESSDKALSVSNQTVRDWKQAAEARDDMPDFFALSKGSGNGDNGRVLWIGKDHERAVKIAEKN